MKFTQTPQQGSQTHVLEAAQTRISLHKDQEKVWDRQMSSQGRMQKEKKNCFPRSCPWKPNTLTAPLPNSRTAFHQAAVTLWNPQHALQKKTPALTQKPRFAHSYSFKSQTSPALHYTQPPCQLGLLGGLSEHKPRVNSQATHTKVPLSLNAAFHKHTDYFRVYHVHHNRVLDLRFTAAAFLAAFTFFLLDPGKHPLNTAAVAASKTHLLTAASLA